MSEENNLDQKDKILKMICEVKNKYKENFDAQAKLFKEIVPNAMNDNAKEKLKDLKIDERSFEDPFTFMLDFLGRGDDGRRAVAQKLMGEEYQKKYETVLYLGIQNLTRVKFSHLEKKTDEKCKESIQECLKSIFMDGDKLKNTLSQDDFNQLNKIFDKPSSTVTSVLYWLYPKEYIPFDKNSKRLYEKLELKNNNTVIKIEDTWDSYNKVKDALKKNKDFLEDDKFKPSMIIALSMVAWMNSNKIENLLDKLIVHDKNKPKNIILTGIPGTGKTHTVMEYLKNNDGKIGGCEFVQFHPSYDYEDFIEGLKPVPSKDGQIEFKLVDGVFKKLCKKAFKDETKTYVMVIDEINRANLSRVFGELLYCLEYRGKFVSTKMTTYIESLDNYKEHSIDEKKEENKGKFAIPRNVIILGTMNEVDRSIDAFDLALRRRFIWEEVGFDSTALRLFPEFFKPEFFKPEFFEKGFISNIENLIKKAEELNKKLSQDIGANYQLGHTYYFKIADYFDGDFESALCDLWEYHLKSIVREYCKVKFGEAEIEKKLNEYKKLIVEKCDD